MIAVWFSCGAASAVALKLTVEKYGVENVRAVNNPITNEHPDNRRFLNDVSNWVGIEIEDARNQKYPRADCVDVWEDRKAMSILVPGKGSIAPCTDVLKKEARYEWEKANNPDWHVLGFTVDEKKRYETEIGDKPVKISIWSTRFSAAKGNHVVKERECDEADAQAWLGIFRADEPDVVFVACKRKPRA